MLQTDFESGHTRLEDDGSGEPAPMGPGFVIAIVVASAVIIAATLLG